MREIHVQEIYNTYDSVVEYLNRKFNMNVLHGEVNGIEKGLCLKECSRAMVGDYRVGTDTGASLRFLMNILDGVRMGSSKCVCEMKFEGGWGGFGG